MKAVIIVAAAVVLVTVRVALRRRRRGRREAPPAVSPSAVEPPGARRPPTWRGDVALVARREIHERVKGRIFRVGTLVVLLVVVVATVLPSLHGGSGKTRQAVGVVGSLGAGGAAALRLAGAQAGDLVRVVQVPSVAAAASDLRAGRVDVAVIDDHRILLDESATLSGSPADPVFVTDVATYLGVLQTYRDAGLTVGQELQVEHARPLAVDTLKGGSSAATKAPSIIGLVLLFFMLTQYNTWILIGVMQEKSSRVVEVLLATVRPLRLLGGKVVGIGVVALGQAVLVVGTALAAGAAVGSDLLKGAQPTVLVCELVWLLLGYSFYCWVYAAAGSTAERQDQVQTLALPLSIPILLGYIFSITVASTGSASFAFKVLAYLPPTAPFCMPVLVGLGLVTWWQFAASVAITLVSTALVARLAARIYRRAILHTRGRVRLRDVVGAARA